MYVIEQLASAVDDVIGMFEEDLGLTVSRTKTVAVASTPTLTTRLRPRLRKYGIRTKDKVKFLGVDYCGGSKITREVQNQRFQSVKGRANRYRQCGRRAARHLLRTGAAPAIRYGSVIVGAPDALVKQVRQFSCSVEGDMRGKSAFGRLQLSGYDIGTSLATDPIIAWAKAIWDEFAPKDIMQAAWTKAKLVVGRAEKPFAHVAGPAGATIASILRLGWSMPNRQGTRSR